MLKSEIDFPQLNRSQPFVRSREGGGGGGGGKVN